MFKMMKKNEKGFTLVELVVVIAILAILAALLVPRIMGNVDEAKKSKEIANARTLAGEINTHNALVKVNGTGTAIVATGAPHGILSGNVLQDTDLVGDFAGYKVPTSNAEVVIDADGNAVVYIIP